MRGKVTISSSFVSLITQQKDRWGAARVCVWPMFITWTPVLLVARQIALNYSVTLRADLFVLWSDRLSPLSTDLEICALHPDVNLGLNAFVVCKGSSKELLVRLNLSIKINPLSGFCLFIQDEFWNKTTCEVIIQETVNYLGSFIAGWKVFKPI